MSRLERILHTVEHVMVIWCLVMAAICATILTALLIFLPIAWMLDL